MPAVTIDGRTVEVEAGTNLIEAAQTVGIRIPYYCYHPRLSVVGQCRMCLVEIEGLPGLQAACSTRVLRDGMVVHTGTEAVREAQRGVMELLLLNHPLDCPVCDQAGECSLQDYAFDYGSSRSRFAHRDKRVYAHKERLPLGPRLLLNMNRCIQCTRCVRFTTEIGGNAELALFERGAKVEIGTAPGRSLDHPLTGCLVDLCPVGALTSTDFRFRERVWNLSSVPTICPGCEVGCNVFLDYRRGTIRRCRPRFNPAVNDFWICDHGRLLPTRYQQERLCQPLLRRRDSLVAVTWKEAIGALHRSLWSNPSDLPALLLTTGALTTEAAFLLAQVGRLTEARSVAWSPEGEPRTIPNPQGGLTGTAVTGNRRGAELAGLGGSGIDPLGLLQAPGAAGFSTLVITDSQLGGHAERAEPVASLRAAETLVVLGWSRSALSEAADIVLPLATPAEEAGTYCNLETRLQRLRPVGAPPGAARRGVAILSELLALADPAWKDSEPAEIFRRMADAIPELQGLTWATIPDSGLPLPGSREATSPPGEERA